MANKKRKHHRASKAAELETLVLNNSVAVREGPKKKTWSIHDVRNIQPLTENQEDLFHAFYNGNHICTHGAAGTGKTFLAMYLALCEIFKKETPQDNIIIVRSAVATRDIGFMPGTLEEKMAFYETPYRDICVELLGRPASYDNLKEAGKVTFMPTSYVRGLTWDNAIVVIDEGQNMTFHEINSIMTRLGENSKIIFTGDLVQTDLRKSHNDKSGMDDFIKIASRMDEFATIAFTHNDIVRSNFVKSWIMACDEVVA